MINMRVILALVLLVGVQLSVRTAALQCDSTDAGCPVSTSPSVIDECKGVDKLYTVDYCGGYALCLDDGVGIRYRCPAGFVPGPKCVPEDSAGNSSASCPEVCEDTVNGCPNGTADAGLCPSARGLFIIDDKEACGQFVVCILGQAYSFFCPEGYRSEAAGSGDKCVPDYRCTDKTQPRLPVCEDYETGCPSNDSIQNLPFCSGLTSGQFDNPNQCGSYYVCLGSGQGLTFECPVGYRTDVTELQHCVLDPSCLTPVSPRLTYSATGCKNVIAGCAVRNSTVLPDDCRGKPPYRTNVNDPTRCGYYLKCTWGTGGYPSVEYICPQGFRADVSQTDQICQPDTRCLTANSARLTVTLKSASEGEGAVCTNVAFGCPRSTEPVKRDECSTVKKWTRRPVRGQCRQYLLCQPNGEALEVDCPPGYRARVARPPYCVVDPNCGSG